MNKAKLKTYIDTAKAYRKAEAEMQAAARELTGDLFADRYTGPMIESNWVVKNERLQSRKGALAGLG
jgi:hypothetical protein